MDARTHGRQNDAEGLGPVAAESRSRRITDVGVASERCSGRIDTFDIDGAKESREPGPYPRIGWGEIGSLRPIRREHRSHASRAPCLLQLKRNKGEGTFWSMSRVTPPRIISRKRECP